MLPLRPNPKIFPRRDGALYQEEWQGAIASNPEWVTITSYNEWYEGTQIEPGVSYGTKYLDLTASYVNQFKGNPASACAKPIGVMCGWHALPRNGLRHMRANGELLAAVRRAAAVRLPHL